MDSTQLKEQMLSMFQDLSLDEKERCVKIINATFHNNIKQTDQSSTIEYPVTLIRSQKELNELLAEFNDSWVFRGQEDSRWGLLSSYDRARKDLGTVEGFSSDEFQPQLYIREFNGIQYAKELLHKKGFSNIEMLAYLQHYGAPTRLLDFTFSFYVAFAFAFEKKIRKSRAIFAINLEEIENQYILLKKSKESQKITYSPNTNDNDQEFNIAFYYDDIVDEHWRFKWYNPNIINKFRFIANIYIKDYSEKHGETPPSTIIPYLENTNNPRILAQKGLFLFPTSLELTFEQNFSLYLEKNKDKNIIKKIIFSEDCYSWAYNLLDMTNLSSRTLYPDLYGLVRSISLL